MIGVVTIGASSIVGEDPRPVRQKVFCFFKGRHKQDAKCLLSMFGN